MGTSAEREARYRVVLAKWREIEAAAGKVVSTWELSLARLRGDSERLRATGRWVRGPDHMLGVLGMTRAEVRHSRIIAWLLDPIAKHGLGTEFLERVLNFLFPGERFDRLASTTTSCEVSREGCRADIVVRGADFSLVVENKVDADEGDDQCNSYFAAFGREPGARFAFLTPDGRAPRSASDAAFEAFGLLSYPQVRALLAQALEVGAESAPARDVAVDYLRSLREAFE